MGAPWFELKAYGIGVSPKRPAGWIALAIYVAAVVATAPITRHLAAPRWMAGVVIGLLTVAFLLLMLAKSDRQPWRWRWGGR
jgi:hypothetical protein